jgi:hypothetical protein
VLAGQPVEVRVLSAAPVTKLIPKRINGLPENLELPSEPEVQKVRPGMPLLVTYLGHKNIQHTECYTELSPKRFKEFLARPRWPATVAILPTPELNPGVTTF